MHAKRVQRIVIAERRSSPSPPSRSRTRPAISPIHSARHRRHKPRRRRNRHQPRHRARDRSQRRRLAIAESTPPRSSRSPPPPRQSASPQTRDVASAARRQRRPRIEPEPPHPQQTRPDKTQHHRVRRHRPLRIPQPLARDTAPSPAPETPDVTCTTVPPAKSRHGIPSPSAAFRNPPMPHTMCAIGLYTNNRPQHHEHQHRRKLHPLRKRSRNQRRRNDRKHQLVHHERLLRNRRRIRPYSAPAPRRAETHCAARR